MKIKSAKEKGNNLFIEKKKIQEAFQSNFCTNYYYGALIRRVCPNVVYLKLNTDDYNRGDPRLVDFVGLFKDEADS